MRRQAGEGKTLRVRFRRVPSFISTMAPMNTATALAQHDTHHSSRFDDRAGEFTRLLAANESGDGLDAAFGLVYQELKGIAHRALLRSRGGTLETTGLVHEAYAKLATHDALALQSRKHFFALCAQAMRQIVIDHARRRQADKRGAGQPVATLTDNDIFDSDKPEMFVALDSALTLLQQRDARLVELLQLRLFAGLDLREIALLLDIGVRQLQRDWQRARIWLAQALLPDES